MVRGIANINFSLGFISTVAAYLCTAINKKTMTMQDQTSQTPGTASTPAAPAAASAPAALLAWLRAAVKGAKKSDMAKAYADASKAAKAAGIAFPKAEAKAIVNAAITALQKRKNNATIWKIHRDGRTAGELLSDRKARLAKLPMAERGYTDSMVKKTESVLRLYKKFLNGEPACTDNAVAFLLNKIECGLHANYVTFAAGTLAAELPSLNKAALFAVATANRRRGLSAKQPRTLAHFKRQTEKATNSIDERGYTVKSAKQLKGVLARYAKFIAPELPTNENAKAYIAHRAAQGIIRNKVLREAGILATEIQEIDAASLRAFAKQQKQQPKP